MNHPRTHLHAPAQSRQATEPEGSERASRPSRPLALGLCAALLAGCALPAPSQEAGPGDAAPRKGRRVASDSEAPPTPLAASQESRAVPTSREGSESYADYGQRPFVDAREDNLSTFSIDVDTGSYTIVRRKLREGQLPPPSAVRVEEFVNFFRQRYPDPALGEVFRVCSEAAASPFRPGKTILRVGLQGRRISASARKPANLVFLIDTSGSMQSADKLGLLKQSLALLVENLRPEDRVAICTYAGSVTKVLDPTPASERGVILRALSRLSAGGSTAMASGIELAYGLAARGARAGVSSRVFVCSDGDANVGPTSHEQILASIAAQRARGITLGTIGFGMGNYKDALMEQLADHGNGSYAYVDSLEEARRLFEEELASNLEVIARDVKLQVAFDPQRVRRYRLLGYENRAILDEDFRRDAVDAGEVGAGHSVTAVYELELVDGERGALGEVRLRYKPGEALSAEGEVAEERRIGLTSSAASAFLAASQRFRFAVCVAEFAEVLRRSPHSSTRLADLCPLVEASLDPRHDEREHELLAGLQRARWLSERGGEAP